VSERSRHRAEKLRYDRDVAREAFHPCVRIRVVIDAEKPLDGTGVPGLSLEDKWIILCGSPHMACGAR